MFRVRHFNGSCSTIRLFVQLITPILFFFPVLSIAQFNVDSLLQVSEQSESDLERVQAYQSLSEYYMGTNPVKAFEYAEMAMNKTEEAELKSTLTTNYKLLATSSIYLGKYEDGLKYFELDYEHSEQTGDTLNMANVIGNIGMVHIFLGNYSEALKKQFEALKIFEELRDTAGILNTNLAIGNIYMENGKYPEALKHDSISLLGYQALDNKQGTALVSGNMANIFSEIDEFEKAQSFHLKAIELYRELEAPIDLSRELTNLATLYEHQGDLIKAIEANEESMKIIETTGFAKGISQARGNLGAFYLTSYQARIAKDTSLLIPDLSNTQLLDRAITNLQVATDIAEQSEDHKVFAWYSEKLSTALHAKGDFEAAFNYFKISNTWMDSVHSLESQKQIEQLTTEREVALAEKQIELDRLAVQKKRNERAYFIAGLGLLALLLLMIYRNYKNQLKSNLELESKNNDLNTAMVQLKETQDQLVESERQKEKALIRSRISQDIHDDISSGLTKISWLSERLNNKRKKGDDAGLESIVDKINNTSRRTMSKLGEIIWSTNPTRDNIPSFLSYVKDHAIQFFEGSPMKVEFDFQNSDQKTSIDPEVRRNLFLVVKEALNNAFKYSEANQISIDFSLVDNHYKLSVSDDGVGMTEGVIQGGGDGLYNMKDRMSAIHGEIDIDSNSNQGTHIHLSGPLTIS